MHRFIQDFSFSFRSLRRSPGFTIASVLTLALGIAATVAVFSVINAVLLHPLPYPAPQNLVILRWQDQTDLTSAAFLLLKHRAHSFTALTAVYPVNAGVNISAAGQPFYVKALPVTQDFFQTLGCAPEIGQPFSAEQSQPKAPKTAVLSHGLWVQGFNKSPAAIGQDLTINRERYKIIGVMPEQFHSYPEADLWLPLQLASGAGAGGNNYWVIGRLAPEMRREQMQYELNLFAREFHSLHPASASHGTLLAHDLQSSLVTKERNGLALLLTAVAFVFVIACINVAILIMVRTTQRSSSLAIRAALGSSRTGLVLSLLSESVWLSAMGAVIGLILAKESLPVIQFLAPPDLTPGTRFIIDWRVAGFAAAISVIGCLLFGLAPAIQFSRINLTKLLVQAKRTASLGAGKMQTVRVLVLCQIALTVVLLSGTMMLSKSLLNLYSEPLGFDPSQVTVAQIALTSPQYRTSAATNQLLDAVIRNTKTINGVDAVAAVNGLPLEAGLNLPVHPVEIIDAIPQDVEYRPVTPDYFRALGIQLKSGRLLLESDSPGSMPVAIVNETIARRWWPGGMATGHSIRVDEKLGPQPPEAPRQIVGVVADTHEKGPGVSPAPIVFVPFSQVPDNISEFLNKTFLTSLLLRTKGSAELSSQVRIAVQSAGTDLPVATFRSFREVVNRYLARPRFLALLTAAFAGMALLLTTVAIQGLLNYQVQLRLHELAIRVVLGAKRQEIVWTVVRLECRMVLLGVAIGTGGALLAERLLGGLLYKLQSNALTVILGTGILLAAIAASITLLTAIRAAYMEPSAALRAE
ncbi:MAG TPA: ABC transporter permease [Candidatus Acidoferrales bacterium]|nr:ABC transporter permease [Candidatus Acidoferrales bacterium]